MFTDEDLQKKVTIIQPRSEREQQQRLHYCSTLRETLEKSPHSRDNGLVTVVGNGFMGGKQLGFSDYEQSTAKKRTKRERSLAEMEVVVPWKTLIDLLEPHYPKKSSKGGRPAYPLATMLRIHLMQQWYSLSDPAMEDALIKMPTMRRFAEIDMISDKIPDETTVLAFRHLLERHNLGEQIFETVRAHCQANGMAIKQ